jgi:hypothetical protein
LRTYFAGLVIFFDCIQDVVLVQADEEPVSGFITYFSGVTVWSDETAVIGLGSNRLWL